MSTHDKLYKELKTTKSILFQISHVIVIYVKCKKKKKDAKEYTAWLVIWETRDWL